MEIKSPCETCKHPDRDKTLTCAADQLYNAAEAFKGGIIELAGGRYNYQYQCRYKEMERMVENYGKH